MSTRARHQTFSTERPNAVWTMIANTHMEDVAPSPIPPPTGLAAVAKVMSAWGGAVLDTDRDQLIVFGGGHGDYSGNEIYTFSLSTKTWTLARNPCATAIINDSGGIESTGYYETAVSSATADLSQPRSRHSYLSCQYVAGIGMVCFGGHGIYPTGGSTSNVDVWNPANNTWSQKTNVTGGGDPHDVTAVDPSTGLIWNYTNNSQGFLKAYAASSGTQTDHGTNSNANEALSGGDSNYHYLAACVDTTRKRMYAVGNLKVYYWDISSNAAGVIHSVDVTTTGDQTAQNSSVAVGLAYHPGKGKIYAWMGGTSVYALDTGTHNWAVVTLDSTNSVTPTAMSANGTYGRWQYSATSDLFVGVNATNENVYTFKLNGAS